MIRRIESGKTTSKSALHTKKRLVQLYTCYFITLCNTNNCLNNFEERPHRMSNDPVCYVHRSRDLQCFWMCWTTTTPKLSISVEGSRSSSNSLHGSCDCEWAPKRHLDRFSRFAGLTQLSLLTCEYASILSFNPSHTTKFVSRSFASHIVSASVSADTLWKLYSEAISRAGARPGEWMCRLGRPAPNIR